MDRSFRNNADFKMNQQNFKLSDFGIETKQNRDTINSRGVINNCEFSEFKVRLMSSESFTRVRVSFESTNKATSPESSHLTHCQSPKVHWKQFGGAESGVIIECRWKSN